MEKPEDWINIEKDEVHCKRERKKARALRKSPWWKKQLTLGICYYCSKPFSEKELTMDHILPVVRGGKSNRSNCVPTCKKCNNEKAYLTPAELILKQLEKED